MSHLACIQHLAQSGFLVLCDGHIVLGFDLDPHAGVGAVVGLWDEVSCWTEGRVKKEGRRKGVVNGTYQEVASSLQGQRRISLG